MRLSLLSKVEDAHEDAVWSCAWATPDLLVTGLHCIWQQILPQSNYNPAVTGRTTPEVQLPVSCLEVRQIVH